MIPRVWNLNREDVPIPPGAVYVGRGRGSVWGNPYSHIPGAAVEPQNVVATREISVARFRVYALERLAREPDWLRPLRGKDLSCWCFPALCHAEVILELIGDGS